MAEQVVAEYKLDVNQAVKGLDKLQAETKQLDKDLDKAGKDGTKALDNVGKETGKLSSGLKKLGGVIAAAFAVDRLISFGKEAVGLAAKAEGISRAFQKLNSPNLLAELRKATRGTVSDLDLMQKAVQANNFQLPLDKLATLFKFATDRAIETGESVDYLVESIVLGISRKSIPIMDNLGISSVALQEEMKKTGDFAKAAFNIVEQSMQNAGEVADTTAVRLAQLATIWDNFSVTVGDSLINLGTGFAYLLGLLEEIDPVLEGQKKAAKELADAYGDDLKGAVDDMVKSNQELLESQLKVAELEESRGYQNSREAIQNINDAIEAEKVRQQFLREYIKNLKAIYDASVKVEESEKEQIRNVAFLEAAIKALKDERSGDATTRERILAINKELIPLEEELALLLGKETDAQKKLREELEKSAKIRAQVFTGAEMADGIPIVVAMQDTLKGLNELLKEQREILEESPEFSKQYDEASAAIDKLEKKIKEFNDDFIDPSKGFPDINTKGIDDEEGNPWISEEDLAELQQYADIATSIITGISDAIIAGHNRELDSLKQQLDSGQITREEYDQKRRKLERKKAIDEKNAAIFEAIVATAVAVATALTVAPPLGFVLAGIAGALGAVQIGVIASQPLPQFAEGVIGLKGAGTETSDSIHAKLSKGESVMTAAETKQYKDELWAIRKGNFENLIMTKYVKPMIDESLFKGFADIGRSAELNGITANLKDHNILHGLDRLRQSQQQGFQYLAKELKVKNQKRGGYRA